MLNYQLDFDSFELTPSDIFQEIGYGKMEPEDEIVAVTNALMSEVATFIQPSCTFGLYDGKLTGSSVILNGYIFETGNTISGLLKGSERFCLFTATAGTLFQRFQDKIKEKGDILQTFILDTIGSCIAEKAGDIMEKLLEKEIDGYRHTHRFSPGYCGWALTEQKQLFELLGGSPSDITLSASCLMTPVKSISGIVGIGKKVNEKQYGCHFCELETCYKRKRLSI